MIPKFRAWDKVAKVMIYHIEQTYDGLGYFKENENIEDYVGDISFVCFADWLENDQFVIMQSTGLFDKNGEEIWVGDILEVRDTSSFGGLYRGAVEYLDNWGVYGFNLFEAKVLSTNEFKKHSIGFLMKQFGNCFTLAEASSKSHYSYEIIGNIYKNPDLLESVEE